MIKQLPLFDLTKQQTPYEKDVEIMENVRAALLDFYHDATAAEPQVTGIQFPALLPDGRRMTVTLEIED